MRRPYAIAAASVVAVAAALRFATIDTQSFWLDEAVTARLVGRSFGGLFSGIWHGESTPPLYYVLAWLWAKLFGDGEAGLRTLSAVLGTLTILVAIALGRRAGGDRAAVVAGALTACSPLLVWYSQEARAYALLVALCSLSVLLALRVLERPAPGRALAWGAVAALALASHYFAAFVIVPQAAWLAVRLPRPRAATLALAPPTAMAIALAPLALHQRANDTAAFIRDSSLSLRTGQLAKQWLVGYDAPAEKALAVLAGALVLAGLVWLVRRAPRRPVVLLLGGLVAAGVVVPLVVALVGEDDFLTRNLLAALVPALCVLAVGYAAARLAGLAAAGALCAVWLVAVVGVASDPAMQRDDWRGAVRALGPARVARAIVVTPGSGRVPVEHYLPGSTALTGAGRPVAEIDLVGLATRAPGDTAKPPRPADVPPPAPGFVAAGRVEKPTYTVVRFRAAAPTAVDPAQLSPRGLDGTPASVLVQR